MKNTDHAERVPKKRLIGFGIASAMLLALFFACPAPLFAAEQPVLVEAREQVTKEFARLDAALKDTAEKLRRSGLTGEGARSALAKLCADFAYAVDCTAVDPAGKMVTVEPPAFRHAEGTDISGQAQVRQVIQTRKPVLSPIFRAVEGFDAADVEYPVVTPEGQYLGSVSLLFKPEALFSRLLPPLLQGMPVEIWVMDATGRILYDADAPQIGHNLFTSPLYRSYPELLTLGKRIVSAAEGAGSYLYEVRGEDRTAAKQAHWKSAVLYGTEWRIVAIHVEQGGAGAQPRLPLSAVEAGERLEAFASGASLLRALSRGDSAEALQLFKRFYDATPGIYSIQWIDGRGMNRFGYPAGNSLTDYDYRRKRFPDDEAVLGFLEGRKKKTWEKRLIEGGTGVFTFVPLFDTDRYLGLLYTIRIKQDNKGDGSL